MQKNKNGKDGATLLAAASCAEEVLVVPAVPVYANEMVKLVGCAMEVSAHK